MARGGGLRVGVDLDGVVADFARGWVNRYNAQFGTAITLAQATAWHAPAELTHFGSMAGFWQWARTAGDGPGRSLFRDLGTYPDAMDGLRDLLTLAHVVVLTAKPRWAISDTLAWLADLRLPLPEVHVTYHKAAVDCDVYFEDAPHHLEQLRAQRPGAVVCRWVRPWNRPVPGCVDVSGFEDALVVVRELRLRRHREAG
jgi:5'(3')-deoxyribonucleotidase